MSKKGNYDGNKRYIEINEKGNIAHQNLYNTTKDMLKIRFILYFQKSMPCLSISITDYKNKLLNPKKTK